MSLNREEMRWDRVTGANTASLCVSPLVILFRSPNLLLQTC